MKTLCSVLIFFTFINAAFAQRNQPDCKKPQTQLEMNYCANLTYEAVDRKLNEVYQKVMQGLQSRPHNMALYQAQIAWLRYRDMACHSYSLVAEGGTMQPLLYSNCLAKLTNSRTEILHEQLDGLNK